MVDVTSAIRAYSLVRRLLQVFSLHSLNVDVLLMIRQTFFRQLRDTIIRMQPLDKQQQMTGLFEMLMEGVERNLLTRSRDR